MALTDPRFRIAHRRKHWIRPRRWLLGCALWLWAWLAWGLVVADEASHCAISTLEIGLDEGVMQARQAGAGPAILLLHGLFASKEQWDALLCPLAAAGYRAIAPDLAGYGASTGFPIADYGLDNQVARLAELVDRLGLEQVDLAGNSMGGAIAALYARAYPDQVRSLALIGAPFGLIEWGPDVRAAMYEGINPFIPVDIAQLERELSLLLVTPPSLSEEVKEALVADYVQRNRHYQQVWTIVTLFGDALVRPGLRIRTPTLAIWGARDRIFPVTGAGWLKFAFPLGKRVILPGAGHLPHVENTETIADLYLDFLDARGSRLKSLPRPFRW
jgi:pimeloyl-ACP methyl ester carboxylesterase